MTTSTLAPPRLGRIGPSSAGMLLKPKEFDAITDYVRGYRYELIKGVLVVNAIPGPAQADPNETLGYALRDYQKNHPKGAALDKTLPQRYIRVGKDRRQADRVIWAGLGRRPNEKKDVPTIAVEFVSAGKRNAIRDYETKRVEYLSVGVVEYWIIDRFRRRLTVHRKTAKKPIVVSEFETYETKFLPGFVLHMDEIMVAADGWEPEEEEKEELAS
jgi:Uma2 family endonuclease